MTKAEQAANAYIGHHLEVDEGVSTSSARKGYIAGYEQAEKDLALTWQDMVKVVEIVGDLGNRSDFALRGGTTGGIQPFYEEVLSRFNSQREKK